MFILTVELTLLKFRLKFVALEVKDLVTSNQFTFALSHNRSSQTIATVPKCRTLLSVIAINVVSSLYRLHGHLAYDKLTLFNFLFFVALLLIGLQVVQQGDDVIEKHMLLLLLVVNTRKTC
ncbi:hypothetical protein DYB37_004097 [Aphanomyces astaci]|uniref:Uncharacterized protein n=1 Tax=Aphanomyces astaci TaxID=112090 RepID=A0A3R7F1X6_APHAT|nr:hypothetical protein DYB35_007326 [Aphanomyces astaci]RHZ21796.1 hypothetical protein DYB37_004097 [Aphanomyces astaci]